MVQNEIKLSSNHLDNISGLSKNKNLNAAILKEKLDKDKMANIILDAMKRTQSCVELLKKASGELEINQKEVKAADTKIIELQDQLLISKSDQINSFQNLVDNKLKDTIKTQMKSYSDVVMKHAGETLTIRNIKTAVKDIVNNVSEERGKNLILFGVPEESDENLEEKVEGVFSTINVKPRFDATRFGRVEGKRPIRVTVDKTETVYEVLKVAKNLKETQHRNVFISLDKSPEERAERRKLVQELKTKIEQNPSQKFFIKKGEVCSETKKSENIVPSSQEETVAVDAMEKPQWRPPHLQNQTQRRPIRKPVFSETSLDSSEDYSMCT